MNTRFRKKPVIIEACQMERLGDSDLPKWLFDATFRAREMVGSVYKSDGEWKIHTLEGHMRIGWGDWIIRGVHGELYACKPDIFEKTYEAVED